MFEKFISQYADVEKVNKTLNSNEQLAKLAFEFCNKFNARLYEHKLADLDVNRKIPKINVMSSGGIPYGTLMTEEDRDGEYFVFNSPFVNKERGSKRSNSNSRDAGKINVLLRAIEKNKDIPQDGEAILKMTNGLRYAFRVTEASRQPRISLDMDLTISMMEYILKINEENLTKDIKAIQNMYDEYLTEKRKCDDTRATHERFAQGSTAIAIFSEGPKPFYVVVDAKYEHDTTEKVILTSAPKRVNSLSEVPELVSDTTIIRSYFESHKSE